MSAGLERRGYTVEGPDAPLRLGDGTWHSGWTLHASPHQPPSRPPRAALAVSFFADGARRLGRGDTLRRAPHTEDAPSVAAWIGAVPHGAVARHALLPLVWPRGAPPA